MNETVLAQGLSPVFLFVCTPYEILHVFPKMLLFVVLLSPYIMVL